MTDRSVATGRILRSGTRGFVIGCRALQSEAPFFGCFVKVAAGSGEGEREIYGLIYDVLIADDPFASQFIDEGIAREVIEDQRQRRLVPIESSVLSVGYREGDAIYHALPPQPPPILNDALTCTLEEIAAFTGVGFAYFRLVLDNRNAPADELLAASLRLAARARDEKEGRDFLVGAGRELARLLGHDLPRLDDLLRGINPGKGA